MTETLADVGLDISTPLEIAENAMLTPKERVELLHRLKAEATGLIRNQGGIGFSPEEIDEAIEAVKLRAQNGSEPAFAPPAVER